MRLSRSSLERNYSCSEVRMILLFLSITALSNWFFIFTQTTVQSPSQTTTKSYIIKVNQLQVRPLLKLQQQRETWTEQELLDGATCPSAFPNHPPEFTKMKYVCSHLDWFEFDTSCDEKNCSDCIPPHSTTKGKEWLNTDVSLWQEQYQKTLKERRYNLTRMLNQQGFFNKNDGPIIVLTINRGYLFLFYNWVCSLDYNEIKNIKQRTMIVPTDEETIPLIKQAGFNMIFYPHWLGSLTKKVDSKMAQAFGAGAHRWVVSLQIALISDLVELGFDVITQDSDIIYIQDPLPYVTQPKFKHIDIQMLDDQRMDRAGPGNSGFFIVRSNCKTQVFMQTMIKLIGVTLATRSDQLLWNTLINEKMFRMINFETFSREYFASGNMINLLRKTRKEDLPPNALLVHACWTADQFDKIEKFHNIGHYYFTEQLCPQFFAHELKPDLRDRRPGVRQKQYEQNQELKLKSLDLVRDTSMSVDS